MVQDVPVRLVQLLRGLVGSSCVCMVVLLGRDRNLGEDIMDHGSILRRCGCRDQATGTLLGGRCPRLRSRRHGSWWYFSQDLNPEPAD